MMVSVEENAYALGARLEKSRMLADAFVGFVRHVEDGASQGPIPLYARAMVLAASDSPEMWLAIEEIAGVKNPASVHTRATCRFLLEYAHRLFARLEETPT